MVDNKDKYTLQTIVKKCLEQAFYKIPKLDIYEFDGKLTCQFYLDVSDYKIWPRSLIRKTLRKEFPDKKISMTSMADKGWGVGGHIYGYNIDIRISDKEESKMSENSSRFPYTVKVKVIHGYEDDKYGYMDEDQVLDNFFDSLPELLEDYPGDATYGYSSTVSVDVNFQYKSDAVDFMKSLDRNIFKTSLINAVENIRESYYSSFYSAGPSLNHVEYVLHNILDWNRGWAFDKRSLKQIAKACERYDNEYTAQEYADVIRKHELLTKTTKNSIYRT